MKNKVIVVVGPTAVGKTRIAISIAKHYHIDVISGDSIAVYKGLDIGSAKPTIEEQQGVTHHLIDILDVQEDYSVADFQRDARAIIDKNPLNLICGGTGLYIQACLMDYEFEAPKRDEGFAQQYQAYSNDELYQILLKRDPSISMDRIHPNNRKRVLRALEVLATTGNSINAFDHKKNPLYDDFIIYLSLDRELLYKRINLRVDEMIQKGLIEEARYLYDHHLFPKGIGYQELYPYFDGKMSLETAIEDIKKNTRHLAKRQETWFKNQLNSHFYTVQIDDLDLTANKIIEDIDRWLGQ